MRTFSVSLLVLLLAFPAAAQSAAMKPYEFNMDRVKVVKFGGNLTSSDTILVPTVSLLVTAHGSVWAQKGGAQAHESSTLTGWTRPCSRIWRRRSRTTW